MFVFVFVLVFVLFCFVLFLFLFVCFVFCFVFVFNFLIDAQRDLRYKELRLNKAGSYYHGIKVYYFFLEYHAPSVRYSIDFLYI